MTKCEELGCEMELYSHFIMFNAVSCHTAHLSVPRTNHKHAYAIDFKMACEAVRQYYRLLYDLPPDNKIHNIKRPPDRES